MPLGSRTPGLWKRLALTGMSVSFPTHPPPQLQLQCLTSVVNPGALCWVTTTRDPPPPAPPDTHTTTPWNSLFQSIPSRIDTEQAFGLTVLRQPLDHVEFMDLFGIVLRLGVPLGAAFLPLSMQLFQQLPGAVVKCQDLVGDVGHHRWLRGAGESELAQDLSPNGFHPLLLDVAEVQGGASGQSEAHRGQVQQGQDHQSPL